MAWRRERFGKVCTRVIRYGFGALGLGVALLGLSACGGSNDEASRGPRRAGQPRPSDPIALATSAAPAGASSAASVATVAPDGSVRQLRKGANNFTCIPDNVKTPGSDPMCADANGMKWLVSWMTGAPPPTGAPGLIYMLSIGRVGSTTEGKQLPVACLKIGPHLMVVGAPSLTAGYPSSSPGGKAPFAMSAGTPYAHLIVPVG